MSEIKSKKEMERIAKRDLHLTLIEIKAVQKVLAYHKSKIENFRTKSLELKKYSDVVNYDDTLGTINWIWKNSINGFHAWKSYAKTRRRLNKKGASND